MTNDEFLKNVTCNVDGDEYIISILETMETDEEHEKCMETRDLNFKKSDGLLLLYNIFDKTSFFPLENDIKAFQSVKEKAIVPVVFVCNQLPFDPNEGTIHNNFVKDEWIDELCSRYWKIPNVDVSVKDKSTVLEAFETLIRVISSLRQKPTRKESIWVNLVKIPKLLSRSVDKNDSPRNPSFLEKTFKSPR